MQPEGPYVPKDLSEYNPEPRPSRVDWNKVGGVCALVALALVVIGLFLLMISPAIVSARWDNQDALDVAAQHHYVDARVINKHTVWAHDGDCSGKSVDFTIVATRKSDGQRVKFHVCVPGWREGATTITTPEDVET